MPFLLLLLSSLLLPTQQTDFPVWEDPIRLRPIYTHKRFLCHEVIRLIVMDKDALYSNDRMLGIAVVPLNTAISGADDFSVTIYSSDQPCGVVKGTVFVHTMMEEQSPAGLTADRQTSAPQLPPRPRPLHADDKERGLGEMVNEWTQSLVDMVAPASTTTTKPETSTTGNRIGDLLSFSDNLPPPLPARDIPAYKSYLSSQASQEPPNPANRPKSNLNTHLLLLGVGCLVGQLMTCCREGECWAHRE